MIIDAHVHYTPPELAASLDEFVASEPYWGLLMGGPSSVQGWAPAERMIEDMDRAGVDKVVLVGEYRRRHDGCVARNDAGIELARRFPDRIVPFAVIQPKAGPAALEELRRCVDLGMRGVGELGPYGQGYRLDDPDFLRLVEACIRYDLPMNLHVNEEVGAYYPGKATTPLVHYYQLAERYPELRLILAHWGGGLMFYELSAPARCVLRNVCYDTAASPLLFETQRIFAAALACVSPRKILYATDYPLRLYGRRQSQPTMQPFLAEVDALGLDDETRSDILGRNAARLLGLLPHVAPAEAPAPRPRRAAVISRLRGDETAVSPNMAVAAVALAWPATRSVFEKHGIPWQDQAVPYWEPILQAAAVRGYGPAEQAHLMAELAEAAGAQPAADLPADENRLCDAEASASGVAAGTAA